MARSERGHAMSMQKLRTKIKNDVTFSSYYNMLKNMAENSFKWDNLPNDIDPIFIEKMLYQYGLVTVFNDPIVGLVALPAIIAGGFNIYGMPERVRAFSPRTGFSQLLKYSPVLELSECVLIHNTNRDLNSSLFKGTIGMFTERLTEMKRTEDVNIFAQRTPVTMVVPEGQVETYTNLFDRYQNLGQIIFGYKGLDVEAIKAIKTDAPWVADKVDDLFIKTWNEAIGFLGISNVAITKKERVNTEEATLSQGSSMTFRHIRQEPREWAISRINAKWNTNISIGFSETYRQNEVDMIENEVEVIKEEKLAEIDEEGGKDESQTNN